jgi:hypothetical protein
MELVSSSWAVTLTKKKNSTEYCIEDWLKETQQSIRGPAGLQETTA